MKKLRLEINEEKTISEAFEEFIYRCNYKNLRLATIKHYRGSWKQISKHLEVTMKVSSINKKTINDVIIRAKQSNIGSQTIPTQEIKKQSLISLWIKAIAHLLKLNYLKLIVIL
ncbi:hypothetical protein FC961_10740 [Clostridium botulinum]|nr:hypothetical protein [Clostridium botulinum]NFO92180.1 hypothetical protein [Clostridium botulinum]